MSESSSFIELRPDPRICAAIRQVAARHETARGNCALFALALNDAFDGEDTFALVDGEHYRYVDHVAWVHRGWAYDGAGARRLADLGREWPSDDDDGSPSEVEVIVAGEDLRQLVGEGQGDAAPPLDREACVAELRIAAASWTPGLSSARRRRKIGS